MVEWGRLLSGCGVNSSTQGSNPCLPASCALVAQWIERLVADQKVTGSNPVEGTRDRKGVWGITFTPPGSQSEEAGGRLLFQIFGSHFQ